MRLIRDIFEIFKIFFFLFWGGGKNSQKGGGPRYSRRQLIFLKPVCATQLDLAQSADTFPGNTFNIKDRDLWNRTVTINRWNEQFVSGVEQIGRFWKTALETDYGTFYYEDRR